MQKYWVLTKPGIVRSNLFTAFAGYMLVAGSNFNAKYLLITLFGIGLIISSGSIWNNILDIPIDKKMERTKNRPLVVGSINIKTAYILGTTFLIAGSVLLYYFINPLVAILGVISWFLYVFIYYYAKRYTSYGTLIGAIPGAMPPVAGYVAYTNNINLTSVILFIILFFWQLPHFYSISLFRFKEYSNANIPTLPKAKGNLITKKVIISAIGAFYASCVWLFINSDLSLLYLFLITIAASYWAIWGIYNYRINEEQWAKRMFGISLLNLAIFCAMIIVEFLL